MAKLDDLFNKKKETAPILDLSKARVTSKEDFKKIFDKVPEFKIRPEKVRTDELKIRDKDLTFKITKKELRTINQPYLMMNPVPVDLRGLKLEDLISVPIEWKMLTNVRPKTKLEEEYYTRMIELGKSEFRTINREKREAMMTTTIRKTKNKAGIVETRAVSCAECGEEFCTGKFCGNFSYDCYLRVNAPPATPGPSTSSAAVNAIVSRSTTGGKSLKIRKKKKFVKRKRSPSKSPRKSKTGVVRSKSEGPKRAEKRKPKHKSGSKSE